MARASLAVHVDGGGGVGVDRERNGTFLESRSNGLFAWCGGRLLLLRVMMVMMVRADCSSSSRASALLLLLQLGLVLGLVSGGTFPARTKQATPERAGRHTNKHTRERVTSTARYENPSSMFLIKN